MQTIITILTVLSMYTTSIQNVNSEYFYNADIENGIVTNLYVYQQGDNGLAPKAMNHYEYDEQGRLTEKVVSRWDIWTKEYQPAYRLQMIYDNDGYELAYSTWNTKEKTWNLSSEKTIYQFEDGQLLSTNSLQRNNQGEYQSVEHTIIMNPYEDQLLAGK